MCYVSPCHVMQFVRKIVLSADEFLIVGLLNKAVEEHPSVTFGSYPYFSNPAFKTVRVRPAPYLDTVSLTRSKPCARWPLTVTANFRMTNASE